jgi:hypothetical protein
MTAPFSQCQLCYGLVKEEKLFAGTAYRFQCRDCELAVCAHCAASALDATMLCYRCDPEAWSSTRAFCVQLTLGLVDRQAAEFTRTFVQPRAAPTMRAALQEAIDDLPTVLATVLDRALVSEMCKQTAIVWDETLASADQLSEYGWRAAAGLIGLNPSFVLRVPSVLTNESGASLAMHCFPVDVSRVKNHLSA